MTVVVQTVVDGGLRDASLGRLRFVTVFDDLKEALGDSLDAVGAAVVPGERRPRPFSFSLPVHGHPQDGDSFEAGERLRRQVRALLENPQARLEGLYFAFDVDPDLNGWLLVGGGELAYATGGPTFADYKLDLSDCFRIATLRTHRPARRLDSCDRRLSTTPRDYLGTLYSTDFAGFAATRQHVLPSLATDLEGVGTWPALTSYGGLDGGSLPAVFNRPDGEVLSFEQPESEQGKSDVVVCDRRGNTAPTYTLAGDIDPQAVYGWEELYGPDQPLTSGDVPAMHNGMCRLRWVPATSSFALEFAIGGAGYAEVGRVTVFRDSPAGTEAQYTSLVSTRLVEWTPERAVLRVRLGIGTTDRVDLYFTLQRGWQGPRIEAYANWTSAGLPGVALRFSPFTAGATTLGKADGTTAVVNGTTHATSMTSSGAPWAYLLPTSPNLVMHLAMLQGQPKIIGRVDSVAYGAPRNGVSVVTALGAAFPGYLSAMVNLAPRGSEAGIAASYGNYHMYDCRNVPELVAR